MTHYCLSACCDVIGTVQVSPCPPRDRRERVIRGALGSPEYPGGRNHRTGNWQLGRKEPLEESYRNPRHRSTIIDSRRWRVAGREGDEWRIYRTRIHAFCFQSLLGMRTSILTRQAKTKLWFCKTIVNFLGCLEKVSKQDYRNLYQG